MLTGVRRDADEITHVVEAVEEADDVGVWSARSLWDPRGVDPPDVGPALEQALRVTDGPSLVEIITSARDV